MSDCVSTNSIDPESQSCDQPIKNLKDILSIRKILEGNKRNQALFTLGINSNITPEDIVTIKTSQVKNIKPGEPLEICDQASGEVRRYVLNGKSIAAIYELIETEHLKDDQELFQSQRGGPLTLSSINRLVGKWCDAIHLDGNYGAQTLRKTWGYHQYLTFKTCIQNISYCLGHDSQKKTLDYLGISIKQVDDIFLNEL